MLIKRHLFEIIKESKKSFLLLGPRQSGKSTLIRELNPDLEINLVDEAVFLQHLRNPSLIKEVIANRKTVFIDEIQRIPSLLNTIQYILDKQKPSDKTRFWMTGSSARKLRRGKANLLPSRIFTSSKKAAMFTHWKRKQQTISACTTCQINWTPYQCSLKVVPLRGGARRTHAGELQAVREVGVTKFAKQLLLAFRNAKVQGLDFLARSTNEVVMVMMLPVVNGHFVMGHAIGEIALLDDPQFLEHRQRAINRDCVAAMFLRGTVEEFLKRRDGKRAFLIENSLEHPAAGLGETIRRSLDPLERIRKSILFCNDSFGWLSTFTRSCFHAPLSHAHSRPILTEHLGYHYRRRARNAANPSPSTPPIPKSSRPRSRRERWPGPSATSLARGKTRIPRRYRRPP